MDRSLGCRKTIIVFAMLFILVLVGGTAVHAEKLSIGVNQTGFQKLGIKPVVFRSNEFYTDGILVLKDVHDRVVFENVLKYWGEYSGLGHHWIGDFSNVTEEGKYYLFVKFNEVETSIPHEIVINDTAYGQLAGQTMAWFHYQRCGCKIDGWHGACHLDDGVVRSFFGDNFGEVIEYKDLAGGWHDAGDYNKWYAWGWQGIYALSGLWDALQPNWAYLSDGTNLPDVLEEAWWEADFYIRSLNEDGSLPYGVVSWIPDPEKNENNHFGYWGPPEHESDNIGESGDERSIWQEWPSPRVRYVAHAWSAAALAKLAYATKPFDSHRSEQAVNAVEQILDLLALYRPLNKNMIYVDGLGGIVVANLYLAQITGDSSFYESATRGVEDIVKGNGFGLWSIPLTQWPIATQSYPFLHVVSLLEFLDRIPDNMSVDLQNTVRAELREFVDGILRLSTLSPYGQVADYDLNSENPKPISPYYSNTYYAGLSYILARSSEALDDIELLKYAQTQLQWIFGLNPYEVSMGARIGWNYPKSYHHRYGTIPGGQHAIVPGGIINGFVFEDGRINNVVIYGPSDGRAPYYTNEYWIVMQSWVVLATSYLQKTLAAKAIANDLNFNLRAWMDEVAR